MGAGGSDEPLGAGCLCWLLSQPSRASCGNPQGYLGPQHQKLSLCLLGSCPVVVVQHQVPFWCSLSRASEALALLLYKWNPFSTPWQYRDG